MLADVNEKEDKVCLNSDYLAVWLIQIGDGVQKPQVRAVDPENAEQPFRRGILHRHRGEFAEAESSWRRILGLRRLEQSCSMDQKIYRHLTLKSLAMLVVDCGDRPETSHLWSAVLDECPGDLDARAMLDRLALGR